MISVREAGPSDASSIRGVLEAAFPTSAEADLVGRVLADGDGAVSLVAEDGGATVGHILFSRMDVEADGRPVRGLGLAPVAVLPERQSHGIGAALIQAGLKEAKSLRTDFVFVLGEPGYYGRFGFTAEAAAPFASPYAGPYFQALSLRDWSPCSNGRAGYAPAFAGLE